MISTKINGYVIKCHKCKKNYTTSSGVSIFYTELEAWLAAEKDGWKLGDGWGVECLNCKDEWEVVR